MHSFCRIKQELPIVSIEHAAADRFISIRFGIHQRVETRLEILFVSQRRLRRKDRVRWRTEQRRSLLAVSTVLVLLLDPRLFVLLHRRLEQQRRGELDRLAPQTALHLTRSPLRHLRRRSCLLRAHERFFAAVARQR